MISDIKKDSHKRRILWPSVLIAVFGGMAGYYYLHPESLPEWAKSSSVGGMLQTTTVYKWQDATGAWHVSDQPPPAGTEYKVEKYRHDTNVLPLPPELQRQ